MIGKKTQLSMFPNYQNNSPRISPDQPSLSFVCIVEAGKLEEQVLRMIESLRRWGGKLSNAHVMAVTPRLGSPLSRETLRAFRKFDVDYIYAPLRNWSILLVWLPK